MAWGNTIGDLLVRIGVDASGLSSQIGKVEKRFEQLGTRMYFMGGRITAGVTAPIIGATAAVAKFGLEFDKAMTESLAIMDDVTPALRKQMEDMAIQVSKTSKFTASEAAEGYYHLASAGLDAQTALKGLPIVTQFAQAGVMNLAKSAEYLAGATAAVGLKTGDAAKDVENMARVADVLTMANNKALGTIQDFAAGLSGKLGPQLRIFNKSVEEGTALLMAYAQQNIRGSAASQQAYIFMRDMARFSAKNEGAWKTAGINVFDSVGRMREVGDIVNDLTKAMDGLSDKAKTQLFAKLGFTDRSRAATQYLLGMGDAMKQWRQELMAAQGATEEVAKRQMTAVVNQLKAAWHTIQAELIGVFNEFAPVIQEYVIPALRMFGGLLSDVTDRLSRMTPQTKAMIAAFAGSVALIGPVVTLMGSWLLMIRAATAPVQLLTKAIQGLTAAQAANAIVAKSSASVAGTNAAATSSSALTQMVRQQWKGTEGTHTVQAANAAALWGSTEGAHTATFTAVTQAAQKSTLVLSGMTQMLGLVTAGLIELGYATVKRTGEWSSLWHIVEAIIPPLGIVSGLFKGLTHEVNWGAVASEMGGILRDQVHAVSNTIESIHTVFGLIGEKIADFGHTMSGTIAAATRGAIGDFGQMYQSTARWIDDLTERWFGFRALASQGVGGAGGKKPWYLWTGKEGRQAMLDAWDMALTAATPERDFQLAHEGALGRADYNWASLSQNYGGKGWGQGKLHSAEIQDEMLRLGRMDWTSQQAEYYASNPLLNFEPASNAQKNRIKEWTETLSGDWPDQLKVLTEGWAGASAAVKENAEAVATQMDAYDKLRTKMPTGAWLSSLASWWNTLSKAQQTNEQNLSVLWESYSKIRASMTPDELNFLSPFETMPGLQGRIRFADEQANISRIQEQYAALEKAREGLGFGDAAGLSDKAQSLLTNAEAFRNIWGTFREEDLAKRLTDIGPALSEITEHVAWDEIPVEVQAMINAFHKLAAEGKTDLVTAGKAVTDFGKSLEEMQRTQAAKATDLTSELGLFGVGFGKRDVAGLRKNLAAQAAAFEKQREALISKTALIPAAERDAALASIDILEERNDRVLALEHRLNLLRLAEAAGFSDSYLAKYATMADRFVQIFEDGLKTSGIPEWMVGPAMAALKMWARAVDDQANKELETQVKIRKEWEKKKKTLSDIASMGNALAGIMSALGFTEAGNALSQGIGFGQSAASGILDMRFGDTPSARAAGAFQAALATAQTAQALSQTKGQGNRALMGAGYGMQVGGSIVPGYGHLVGAGVGAAWGALTHDPGWAQIGDRIKASTGVTTSEETQKHIEASAKDEFKRASGAQWMEAEIFHLNDIIKDAGGVTASNFTALINKLRDSFSMLETGRFSLTQTTQVLDENFAAFAEFVQNSEKVAKKSFTELLALNARFGTESKAIRDYISGMSQSFSGGAVDLMAGMASQFTFTLDGKKYTLDQLISKIQTAKNNVEVAKERLSDYELTLAGRKSDPTPAQKETLQEYKDELATAQEELDAMLRLQGVAKEQVGPEIERIGNMILTMFNNAVAKGNDVIDVMTDLAPSMNYLNGLLEATGYTPENKGLAELLNFQKLIADNEALVKGVGGLNQMFLALVNTGGMTQDVFDDTATQIGVMHQRLIDAGFTERQAMTMIAPLLSNMIAAASEYGFTIDENTGKLILQGQEMGLIKDKEITTNDILLQGLAAIIKALGGEIPEAWKRLLDKAETDSKDSAEKIGGEMREILNKYKPDKWVIEYGFKSDGSSVEFPPVPGNGDVPDTNYPVPQLAEGGIIDHPTLVLAGEKTPEAIIPLDRLSEMRGDGGDGVLIRMENNIYAMDAKDVEQFMETKALPAAERIWRNNTGKHRSRTRRVLSVG